MNVELVPEDRGDQSLGKVVLFFPRFRAPQYPLWLPMEIMTVGSALFYAGFTVRLFDERLLPEAEELFLEESQDALFVGSSARPGDQVIRTYEIFKKLKEINPDVVTVFGGWFPTTFTEACMDIDPVDIVIQGQGDSSIVEVAHRLLEGRDMSGLAGVNSKLNGQIIRNDRRPLEDIEKTPRIPFEKFPVDKYVTFDNCLSYYTSRGCPGTCRFCSVPIAYPEQWSGYSPERVLDEMELLSKKFGVKLFKIHDTDFFPDQERALAICHGIVERKLDIRWIADVRISEINSFTEEMWASMRNSGCCELVTGGEAGCDKMLEFISKNCTADDIYRAAQLVTEHGMKIRLNFILGLHGEKRKELLATLSLVRKLQAIGDTVMFQFYRYTPAPPTDLGVETWRLKTRNHDGSVPMDAESIVSIPINHDLAELFWLSKAEEKRVKRLYYFYLPLVYYFRDYGKPGLKRWILKRIIDIARIRVRYGITAFPFEEWLCKKFNRPLPRSREFEWKQELC